MTSRRCGSEESRSRLFEAAKSLFAKHGYERTTVREIGKNANVDPALIARYFGSKAGLYIQTMRPEALQGEPSAIDPTLPSEIENMLERLASNWPTPALHAAIRPHEDPELQRAAMKILEVRLLAPAKQIAAGASWNDAQLRAEIAVAALAGVVASRASQAFPELSKATSAEAGELIAGLVAGILQGQKLSERSVEIPIVR